MEHESRRLFQRGGDYFRASLSRDSKLNRDVAQIVLPDSFASDPDRLARFTREAHTLVSLNHRKVRIVIVDARNTVGAFTEPSYAPDLRDDERERQMFTTGQVCSVG